MFRNNLEREYLNLAKIVYGGKLYYQLNNYKLKNLFLDNSYLKKITDFVLKDDNFFSYKNEENGFCANAFENIKTGNIVIAYRGTERPGFGENISDFNSWNKDISTDVNLIEGFIDTQVYDAWNFYKLVKEQNKNAKIILTGHSLGGALAQLTAAKVYSESCKKIISQKLKTYTFNAPGCKHLLKLYNCFVNYNYSFIENYTVMNDWCGMFGENIGETYLLPPIPLNEVSSTSLNDILNNIFLTTHEGIFDYCENNCNVIRKLDNFNQNEGLSLWYYDKNNTLRSVHVLKHALDNLKSKLHFSLLDDLAKIIKDDKEKNSISNMTIKEKNNFEIFKEITKLIEKAIENITIENLKTAIDVLKKKKILAYNENYIEDLKSNLKM